QNTSLALLANQIRISRSGLSEPNAPNGVFLLAGSSGVGKTETALALADTLYGGEQNLITINMSEFQESHTVSTLKGAPPGYVGYGEGGVLTEAVRRKPYSVILLDEIEKAHPDVHEIFYQVFDRGGMEDGEGRYIDFKNTLILLTSNVGSDALLALNDDNGNSVDISAAKEAITPELREVFPDAFLGRLVIVPYMPLSRSSVEAIIKSKLQRVSSRFNEHYGITINIESEVYSWLIELCQVRQSGARLIANNINQHISSLLSEFALNNLSQLDQYKSVVISLDEQGKPYIETSASDIETKSAGEPD
ncbi:AAA family ATPase, partial [Photobacterium sanctipauli]